ncbi:hypothetical protein DID88_000253 [Monilinia fructigena]|uniref:Endosomal/vacuolar adapter protein YPT35 n=1 Tax=Monilinia fructigena TaxID=38457 RepID=A0A395ILT1_9HELO|nr:hypothetical protein DID88_000253 [Monilinia fructigena]
MESVTIPHSSNGNDIGTLINTPDSHPHLHLHLHLHPNSNSNSNPNPIKPEVITTTHRITTSKDNNNNNNHLSNANENEPPITSPTSTTQRHPSHPSHPHPTGRHTRPISHVSIESIDPNGITLQDNTTEGEEGDVNGKVKNEACWARSVVIEDFVVVNGTGRMGIGGAMGMGISNIGSFVVWNVKGTPITIRNVIASFADLRGKLLRTFPNSAGMIPELPRKSVISKFRPKFLENRRAGLQYFLNCIILNPEFSSSPVLKEFLFS